MSNTSDDELDGLIKLAMDMPRHEQHASVTRIRHLIRSREQAADRAGRLDELIELWNSVDDETSEAMTKLNDRIEQLKRGE